MPKLLQTPDLKLDLCFLPHEKCYVYVVESQKMQYELESQKRFATFLEDVVRCKLRKAERGQTVIYLRNCTLRIDCFLY